MKLTSNKLKTMTATLKSVLDENIKLTAVDYASFKEKLAEFCKRNNCK